MRIIVTAEDLEKAHNSNKEVLDKEFVKMVTGETDAYSYHFLLGKALGSIWGKEVNNGN